MATQPTPTPAGTPSITFGLDLDSVKSDLAVESAILLLLWSNWVHRRTETVEFLDYIHVRRGQTVDFSLLEDASSFKGARIVPVAVLAKRTLRDFDLRDAEGAALSMFTRHENVKISRQILIVASCGPLGIDEQTFEAAHPEIVETFGQIADFSVEDAVKLASDLEEGSGPGDPTVLSQLSKNDFLIPLAHDLARNFVLFTPLPEAGTTRRLVKFAYDERLRRKRPQSASGNWIKRLWEQRDRFKRAIGLRPVVFRLPAPAVSEAASYHVEVVAPQDLVIQVAQLVQRNPPKGDEQGGAGNEDHGAGVADNAGTDLCDPVVASDRAHLSVGDRARGVYAEISIVLRVRSSSIFQAARNISVATTAILGGGLILHWFGVPSHGEVASLLLVVLPGVYATYLARPGEHRLVQHVASGIRLLIAGQAVLSFIAATALALGFHPGWKEGIWVACFVVSLVGSVLTWIGNRRSALVEAAEAERISPEKVMRQPR